MTDYKADVESHAFFVPIQQCVLSTIPNTGKLDKSIGFTLNIKLCVLYTFALILELLQLNLSQSLISIYIRIFYC